jgi:pimeloyl-ACP methyl ester carboxylesterase
MVCQPRQRSGHETVRREEKFQKEKQMSNSMRFVGVVQKCFRSICVGLLLLAGSVLSAQNRPQGVKNIVLVHGAWADGSGWRGVYDILVKDGYNVSMVQEPETTFNDDVTATKRMVYVAAHMPDAGEKESEDGKRFPSDLAKSGATKSTPDGFTYIDPARFHELFSADLPADQAAFMARSQVFNYGPNFSGTITAAAWRTKPSWMVVAGSDRTINPDLERWYAKRANSHTTEVPGASHCVFISHPKEVAGVIESAARASAK